jgi:hypothetical protein
MFLARLRARLDIIMEADMIISVDTTKRHPGRYAGFFVGTFAQGAGIGDDLEGFLVASTHLGFLFGHKDRKGGTWSKLIWNCPSVKYAEI